jgi:hypothetical protein
MIGQTMRRDANRSGPSTWQDRRLISASKSGTGRSARRNASGPASIQTTALAGNPSRSGSGTSVKGPPER